MRARKLFALCTVLVLAANPTSGSNGGRKIVSHRFTVHATGVVGFQFDVSSSGGELRGSFESEGGGKGDIEVVLIEEKDFESWSYNQEVKTYYSSGKVAEGTVSAFVPRGVYLLVFNNGFSLHHSKVVVADIYLKD